MRQLKIGKNKTLAKKAINGAQQKGKKLATGKKIIKKKKF